MDQNNKKKQIDARKEIKGVRNYWIAQLEVNRSLQQTNKTGARGSPSSRTKENGERTNRTQKRNSMRRQPKERELLANIRGGKPKTQKFKGNNVRWA